MRVASLAFIALLLFAAACQRAGGPAPAADANDLKPGHEFRDCADCPEEYRSGGVAFRVARIL